MNPARRAAIRFRLAKAHADEAVRMLRNPLPCWEVMLLEERMRYAHRCLEQLDEVCAELARDEPPTEPECPRDS